MPPQSSDDQGRPTAAARGRLGARPAREPAQPGPSATHRLGIGDDRDGLVYVPRGYAPDRPAPLAIMLHGAGGVATHGLDLLRDVADRADLLILAPESRRQTWDVIGGAYGPDIAFLDRALAAVFSQYAVDPAHIALGGFSDGASYALSAGLANGDLFTHLIAFSPGFLAPPTTVGAPRVYVAHGMQDRVLPIDDCSRRIVPRLRQAGYDVTYHEFDGPHTVPDDVRREAVDWFVEADM